MHTWSGIKEVSFIYAWLLSTAQEYAMHYEMSRHDLRYHGGSTLPEISIMQLLYYIYVSLGSM